MSDPELMAGIREAEEEIARRPPRPVIYRIDEVARVVAVLKVGHRRDICRRR